MKQRAAIYRSHQSKRTGTERELQRAVANRGDTVVAIFSDCPSDGRHGRRRSGWKALLAGLDGIEQIVVQSAGDLPGRKIYDLLNLLARLRDHGVGLYLHDDQIDTNNGTGFTVLEIVEAYRRAKLSAAIKRGLSKTTKRIGRPKVPTSIRRRIFAALAAGDGIRPTARKFGVSPATVMNIKRTVNHIEAEAA